MFQESLAAIIDSMKDDGYSYREIALALAYQIAGQEMFDESAWNASVRPALTVTEKGMSELILDIGSDQDVNASIIVSAIATATGLRARKSGRSGSVLRKQPCRFRGSLTVKSPMR